MKKYLSLILVLLCLVSLCACGGKEETPADPTPEVVSTPEAVVTEPAPEGETVPTQEPEKEEPAGPSALEKAKALEGESVEELIAAIGEPVSREDYAPSCLGEGEDGIWHYEGFAVYTYRENGSESVYAVMEG